MANLPLIEAFERERSRITDMIVEHALAAAPEDAPPGAFDKLSLFTEQAMLALARDIANNTTIEYPNFWQIIHSERDRASLFSIEWYLDIISFAESATIDSLLPHFADDVNATRTTILRLHEIFTHARNVLYNVYTKARDTIIRDQMIAIQELSAPIVPIYPGVLLLPLIGRIDGQRATAVLQTLLDGVSHQTASIVLLDITGVPLVDTMVAHHLIQAARAVRLLGAEVVLVGIGPEIAQTMVQLGINLEGIATRADLQTGLAFALNRLGFQIVAVGRPVLA